MYSCGRAWGLTSLKDAFGSKNSLIPIILYIHHWLTYFAYKTCTTIVLVRGFFYLSDLSKNRFLPRAGQGSDGVYGGTFDLEIVLGGFTKETPT